MPTFKKPSGTPAAPCAKPAYWTPNNPKRINAIFIDQVILHIQSGAGGDGMVAWRREKFVPNGGPAGGDGGHGGSVFLEATHDLNTLLPFQTQKRFIAADGERGKSKNMHGKGAPDLTVKVPCGTLVLDADTQAVIADLSEPGQRILVAQGGRGGRGNARFLSNRRRAPSFAEPGEPCIERSIALELKLIADVGLLGFPNAGKSTLISVLSAARPKIADYPFTTLTPNLGVVAGPGHQEGYPSEESLVMADIPGLIEGASQGVGLGQAFLKHVERTRLLLHLVDVSDCVEHTPLERYQIIRQELARYQATSQDLTTRPQLIVLTKCDAVEPDVLDEWLLALQEAQEQYPPYPVLTISAATGQGIETLRQQLFELYRQLPAPALVPVIEPDTKATLNDDSNFEVFSTGPDEWRVAGGRIERLIRVTDTRDRPAVHRLMNIYKSMGVFKALHHAGVQEGDTVRVGPDNFAFSTALEWAIDEETLDTDDLEHDNDTADA